MRDKWEEERRLFRHRRCTDAVRDALARVGDDRNLGVGDVASVGVGE